MLAPYVPEPYSDFSDPTSSARYRDGLDSVAANLGERALLVIGGEHIDTRGSIESVNPSNLISGSGLQPPRRRLTLSRR